MVYFDPECWICYSIDENDPLIAPCCCKGSLQWVHEKCLKSWIKTRYLNKNVLTDLKYKCSHCSSFFEIASCPLPWFKQIYLIILGNDLFSSIREKLCCFILLSCLQCTFIFSLLYLIFILCSILFVEGLGPHVYTKSSISELSPSSNSMWAIPKTRISFSFLAEAPYINLLSEKLKTKDAQSFQSLPANNLSRIANLYSNKLNSNLKLKFFDFDSKLQPQTALARYLSFQEDRKFISTLFTFPYGKVNVNFNRHLYLSTGIIPSILPLSATTDKKQFLQSTAYSVQQAMNALTFQNNRYAHSKDIDSLHDKCNSFIKSNFPLKLHNVTFEPPTCTGSSKHYGRFIKDSSTTFNTYLSRIDKQFNSMSYPIQHNLSSIPWGNQYPSSFVGSPYRSHLLEQDLSFLPHPSGTRKLWSWFYRSVQTLHIIYFVLLSWIHLLFYPLLVLTTANIRQETVKRITKRITSLKFCSRWESYISYLVSFSFWMNQLFPPLISRIRFLLAETAASYSIPTKSTMCNLLASISASSSFVEVQLCDLSTGLISVTLGQFISRNLFVFIFEIFNSYIDVIFVFVLGCLHFSWWFSSLLNVRQQFLSDLRIAGGLHLDNLIIKHRYTFQYCDQSRNKDDQAFHILKSSTKNIEQIAEKF